MLRVNKNKHPLLTASRFWTYPARTRVVTWKFPCFRPPTCFFGPTKIKRRDQIIRLNNDALRFAKGKMKHPEGKRSNNSPQVYVKKCPSDQGILLKLSWCMWTPLCGYVCVCQTRGTPKWLFPCWLPSKWIPFVIEEWQWLRSNEQVKIFFSRSPRVSKEHQWAIADFRVPDLTC